MPFDLSKSLNYSKVMVLLQDLKSQLNGFEKMIGTRRRLGRSHTYDQNIISNKLIYVELNIDFLITTFKLYFCWSSWISVKGYGSNLAQFQITLRVEHLTNSIFNIFCKEHIPFRLSMFYEKTNLSLIYPKCYKKDY